MEQSLVIIKPDGAIRRRIGALVIKSLMDRGYKVRAFKEMMVPKSLAEAHYAVHRDKPFFPWLVQFITSGRVIVMILEGEDAIQGIRDTLGATFVQKAAPDTLRGKYGLFAGINIAHASDSPENAATEINLWKAQGGLEESESAESNAIEYIETYIQGDVDYTKEIRKTIFNAIDTADTSQDVLESLKELLGNDARGIEEDEISRLAKAILATIEEEVN